MVPTELPTAGKNRRGVVVAALIALCVTGGGAAWYEHATSTAAPKLETAAIDRGTVTSRVTATGTLSALVTVQVGAQVTGRVGEIFVDFNSPVKKGQLIAKIDAQSFDEAVAEARANVAAAQAGLEKADTDAKQTALSESRMKELVDRNLVARADYDAAVAAAASARASVSGAKSAVSQALSGLDRAVTNRGYTQIYAPIDGVVLSRAVDVGQTVAASLSAPTLFTIAGDLSKMQVETSVSEADVGRLVEGQKATFTVDAYPGEKFAGVVRQVRSAPISLQNVVTYTVVVNVDNPRLRLKPGMTANVSFVVDEAADALRLPNAALRYRPAVAAAKSSDAAAKTSTHASKRGGGDDAGAPPAVSTRAVTVLRNNAPEQVKVQLGVSDGSFTQIVSGDVKEGDLVVTGAADDGKAAAPAASNSLLPTGGAGGRGGGRGGKS